MLELKERLDRLERQLDWARDELAAVRALAEPAVAVEPEPAPAPLASAWRALTRGKSSDAVTLAFDQLQLAAASHDRALLEELGRFASAAQSASSRQVRMRAQHLARRVEQELGPPARPVVQAVLPAPRPVRIGPGPFERAEAWLRKELTGPRTFAVAGGTVLLLGVIFFFVLAADRGWVGPQLRLALGGIASLGAIGAGLWVRARYGRVVAASGAVGAGIAGAYATLAAATMIYSYLSGGEALLLAAGIAAVGAATAVAWGSQVLAGLALVGAAAAPGLFALDGHQSWPGVAFALVVLLAAIAVASPRHWLWLDAAVAPVAIVQVLALAIVAPNDDPAAVAVGCAAAFTLLAAGIAWQAWGGPSLDPPSESFALAAGAIAFSCPFLVVPGDRPLGVLLVGLSLVFCAAALAVGRRWRDLGWTIGAEALLLGGLAAAFLLSGRSLTIVWAIEAVVLAGLARKLGALRFEAAALGYLAVALVHSAAIEVVPRWSSHDVPHGASAGLLVLAGAALAVGLLQPEAPHRDATAGLAAVLEPLWDLLARKRVQIRAALAVLSAVLLATGLAALLSEWALTVVLAAIAVGLGLAANRLGERRLQPFALGFLGWAALHALSVEAPPRTVAILPGVDPLTPVASLLAVSAAAVALAALARFEDRGIRWLGPVAGPELAVAGLRRGEGTVRAVLSLVAATAACWAAGLLAIRLSYGPGQLVATALWCALGTLVVLLGARARSRALQVAGFAYVVGALSKASAFDWDRLGDRTAAASLLIAAVALLAAGFAARWANPAGSRRVDVVALASGAVAATAAVVALGRVWDSRSLGAACLAVSGALVAVGAAPYLRRRAGGAEPWLRALANGYWAIGLVVLLFAESKLVLEGEARTITLWAATAGALAIAWRPLREDRVWLAGSGLAGLTAVGSLALVTMPSRLVEASQHPAAHLSALAVVVAAAWAVWLTTPPVARACARWLLAAASALTLYGVSLGVLELAERISTASVTTDFQRGHTALSALWGIGALALYVVGLKRDLRDVRVVGVALLGLVLAKLFFYDLSSLSSVTRALSFLAVGTILLAAGFFAERLVGPQAPAPPSRT